MDKEVLNKAYEILIFAYAKTEVEIWGENYSRISRNEFEKLIQKEEVYFAFDNEKIAGCIHLNKISNDTYSFGLLAVDFNLKGKGVGSELIGFIEKIAQEKGGKRMLLEILKPAIEVLPTKKLLHEWYTRLGYTFNETMPFLALKQDKIEKAKELKVPAVFDCYSKNLT